MATSTPNLILTLPSSGDNINVEVLNGNFEKLDDRLGGVSDSIIVDDLDSANLVHVMDAAARPAVELISHIESAQAGSGWDEVAIVHTRKNITPPPTKGVGLNSSTGAETVSNTSATSIYIPWDGETTLLLSGLPLTLTNFVAFYDANKTFIGRTSGSGSSGLTQRVIKAGQSLTNSGNSSNARFFRIVVYTTSASNVTIDEVDNAQIQLEVGDTATEYEPYEAQTLTVDLPETVYGGTLNWTTGMLVSTLDADDNELAEPKIIQLTPQQLNMRKGVNNVWSNCGETELVYIADTKKYIDQKFAALAAATIGV